MGVTAIAWIPPEVGDQVLARMEGKRRWFNATITRAWADGSWRIAWDDGDWRDQFKFANQIQLVRDGFCDYRVGDKVLARYKSTWGPALKVVRAKGVEKFVPNVPRTRSPRKRVVRKEAYTRLYEDAQRRERLAEDRASKIGRQVLWQCTPGCQQWGG